MNMIVRASLFTLSMAAAAMPLLAQPVEILPEILAPVQTPLAATLPPPPPAPIVVDWSREDAEELLGYIDRVGEEGLDPADYTPARLRAALADGDETELASTASQIFLKLSSDLSLGHVRGDARVGWYVNDQDLNGNEQIALMQRATEQHSVRDTLASLLPTHPQYAELKAVLANTTDKATIDKIRTNLDRWRWLPRDLGQKYVIVNVPAYYVALVEEGRVTARRKAVAGAIKTATPQLSATITGVRFNPWWDVPASIAKEVRGKKGYVSVPNGAGVRYRQPPGPNNALGRVRLLMQNDHAIYLHDTPSKGGFTREARALSHGCIRTDDILGFAEILLAPTAEWDDAKIKQTIAAGKTVEASLAAPVPVYITYFTAAAVAGKNEIVSYKDIYSRDTPVMTALNDRGGTALASAAK